MTTEEKIDERIKEDLTPIDTETEYNRYLDECFGTVSIAGLEFDTSKALRELDETAYNCGLGDWLDAESDRLHELDGEYYNMDEVQAIIDEIEEQGEEENE